MHCTKRDDIGLTMCKIIIAVLSEMATTKCYDVYWLVLSGLDLCCDFIL